jgi:hypothetical protein
MFSDRQYKKRMRGDRRDKTRVVIGGEKTLERRKPMRGSAAEVP